MYLNSRDKVDIVVLVVVAFLTGMLVPAIAQQVQPVEYNFKLNEAEINVISKGLGTQPFAEVAPIMQKMQKQFIDQQPKPKPVDPAAKADPPKPTVKE